MPGKEQVRGGSARRFEIRGWSLLIVSALFFIASTARSGDVLGLLGSLFFLGPCVAFLIPYFRATV